MNAQGHAWEETPDLSHLSEPEWLTHWAGILTELEQVGADHAAAGVSLPPVPAAQLDGRAGMLRAVLESRGACPRS